MQLTGQALPFRQHRQLLRLLLQPGVLDRHGGLVGENGHDRDIFLGEAPRLIHDVQHADDPAIDVQGHGEQRGEIRRPLVDLGPLDEGRVIQQHRLHPGARPGPPTSRPQARVRRPPTVCPSGA